MRSGESNVRAVTHLCGTVGRPMFAGTNEAAKGRNRVFVKAPGDDGTAGKN